MQKLLEERVTYLKKTVEQKDAEANQLRLKIAEIEANIIGASKTHEILKNELEATSNSFNDEKRKLQIVIDKLKEELTKEEEDQKKSLNEAGAHSAEHAYDFMLNIETLSKNAQESQNYLTNVSNYAENLVKVVNSSLLAIQGAKDQEVEADFDGIEYTAERVSEWAKTQFKAKPNIAIQILENGFDGSVLPLTLEKEDQDEMLALIEITTIPFKKIWTNKWGTELKKIKVAKKEVLCKEAVTTSVANLKKLFSTPEESKKEEPKPIKNEETKSIKNEETTPKSLL